MRLQPPPIIHNERGRLMEYLYSVTCTYDGDKSPHWTGRFNNALDAVDTYNKFVDWGLANEYSTVNLSVGGENVVVYLAEPSLK